MTQPNSPPFICDIQLYDDDDDDDDDDDLYIIGAVCLSVCVSQKSLFLYSKDLIVSHVYRRIPYSRDFCVIVTKVIISVFKGSGRFLYF